MKEQLEIAVKALRAIAEESPCGCAELLTADQINKVGLLSLLIKGPIETYRDVARLALEQIKYKQKPITNPERLLPAGDQVEYTVELQKTERGYTVRRGEGFQDRLQADEALYLIAAMLTRSEVHPYGGLQTAQQHIDYYHGMDMYMHKMLITKVEVNQA